MFLFYAHGSSWADTTHNFKPNMYGECMLLELKVEFLKMSRQSWRAAASSTALGIRQIKTRPQHSVAVVS